MCSTAAPAAVLAKKRPQLYPTHPAHELFISGIRQAKECTDVGTCKAHASKRTESIPSPVDSPTRRSKLSLAGACAWHVGIMMVQLGKELKLIERRGTWEVSLEGFEPLCIVQSEEL